LSLLFFAAMWLAAEKPELLGVRDSNGDSALDLARKHGKWNYEEDLRQFLVLLH
jgi:hypothetical protein